MTFGTGWAKSDAFWLMRNKARVSRFGRSFAFLKKGLRFGAPKAMPVDFATIDDPINRAALGCSTASKAEDAGSPHRLTVSLIRCSEIDDAFRDEWRALEDSSLNPNPYFAHGFLEPAMRHLDPTEEVRIVALRRAENSMLVALAPFVFQKGYAKLPLKHVCVWTHAHCFNGAPLIREGFSVAAYSALFDWVDTRPEGSVFIRFAMLPFDGETRNALDEACALRGRGFLVQDYCERAILTTDNDFGEIAPLDKFLKTKDNIPEKTPHSDGRDNVELTTLPIVQINIPTKRATDKMLLRISATLEKLKLKVLRTVSGKPA